MLLVAGLGFTGQGLVSRRSLALDLAQRDSGSSSGPNALHSCDRIGCPQSSKQMKWRRVQSLGLGGRTLMIFTQNIKLKEWRKYNGRMAAHSFTMWISINKLLFGLRFIKVCITHSNKREISYTIDRKPCAFCCFSLLRPISTSLRSLRRCWQLDHIPRTQRV